ncbi:hypothetical protein ACFL26_02500, partial [Patescibacteria group bacterium]
MTVRTILTNPNRSCSTVSVSIRASGAAMGFIGPVRRIVVDVFNCYTTSGTATRTKPTPITSVSGKRSRSRNCAGINPNRASRAAGTGNSSGTSIGANDTVNSHVIAGDLDGATTATALFTSVTA